MAEDVEHSTRCARAQACWRDCDFSGGGRLSLSAALSLSHSITQETRDQECTVICAERGGTAQRRAGEWVGPGDLSQRSVLLSECVSLAGANGACVHRPPEATQVGGCVGGQHLAWILPLWVTNLVFLSSALNTPTLQHLEHTVLSFLP